MSSDIRFDQNNITTVVEEQSFEDVNGNEFLKVKHLAYGARIEGVDAQAAHSPAILDLSFGSTTPKGSQISLFNTTSTNPAILLNAKNSTVLTSDGTYNSYISPNKVSTPHLDTGTSYTKEARIEDELYFENDSGKRIIRLKKRSNDVDGQLQISHSGQLAISVQCTQSGGSLVIYDENGSPSIILQGETGDIYLAGSINEGVDPSVMADIASTLVWED